MNKRRSAWLWAAMLTPLLAIAEPVEVKVESQSLGSALNALAEQLKLQLVYDGALVANLQAPAITGKMEPTEALRKILEGSGLTYRFTSRSAVTLQKVVDQKGARMLDSVRVEGVGSNASAGVNGVNGSSDVTATEDSGSYTSELALVAGKSPKALKDTAQTVSVITHQRMRDQNITDFTTMMNQSTGITTVQGQGGPTTPQFLSRGFAINRIQIDGGAPMDITNGTSWALIPQIDMSMYDHVELLRGADGLFNGYGSPGGVVNLVRKRPLDHTKVSGEAQVGSWDNYRAVFDATAPLAFDGKLRGRVVLTRQEQEFFYDTAFSDKSVFYGILEADITPSTQLAFGYSYNEQESLPFINGLPRFESGDSLGVSRSTCVCFNWSRYDFETQEIFGRIDQSLGEHWKVTANVTRAEQETSYKFGFTQRPVNPVTGQGAVLFADMGDRASTQLAADFVVNGSFELFGQRQLLTVGASRSEINGGGYVGYTSIDVGSVNCDRPPVDVRNFDPNQYPEFASGAPDGRYPEDKHRQWGAFANLQLTFFGPLHFSTGIRYSRADTRFLVEYLDSLGQVRGSEWKYSGTEDVSWPPTYTVSYDVSKTLNVYGSYSDVYDDNSEYIEPSGNPIDPTTGSNIEAGIKWAAYGGRLNASAAFYRLQKTNFPMSIGWGPYASTYGQTPDGNQCCYRNDKDQELLSQGVDLEITGELLPRWQVTLGYTFNDNEQVGTDQAGRGKRFESIVPRHLLKLWNTYRFSPDSALRALTVGGGVTTQSKGFRSGEACVRFEEDANGFTECAPNGWVDYEFTQEAYVLLSARAEYEFNGHWSAALNINNITDENYYQTVSTSQANNWYGEPRNYMLTVRTTF